MSRNAADSLPRPEPVLRTHGLEKHYGQGEGRVCALDSVELRDLGVVRPVLEAEEFEESIVTYKIRRIARRTIWRRARSRRRGRI